MIESKTGIMHRASDLGVVYDLRRVYCVYTNQEKEISPIKPPYLYPVE